MSAPVTRFPVRNGADWRRREHCDTEPRSDVWGALNRAQDAYPRGALFILRLRARERHELRMCPPLGGTDKSICIALGIDGMSLDDCDPCISVEPACRVCGVPVGEGVALRQCHGGYMHDACPTGPESP